MPKAPDIDPELSAELDKIEREYAPSPNYPQISRILKSLDTLRKKMGKQLIGGWDAVEKTAERMTKRDCHIGVGELAIHFSVDLDKITSLSQRHREILAAICLVQRTVGVELITTPAQRGGPRRGVGRRLTAHEEPKEFVSPRQGNVPRAKKLEDHRPTGQSYAIERIRREGWHGST